MTRSLTLDDIADLPTYEREREAFRDHVIALKRRRRVAVGPLVTLLFENRDTIRFQIQEMARVERLATDAAIESELDAYNPLIPEPGGLSATLFIELTADELLREWLPKLLGIESSVVIRVGGTGGASIRCFPEAGHAAQLTRDDITSSVHYIQWTLKPDEIALFGTGPVEISVDHPEYAHSVTLSEEQVAELLSDLSDGTN